MRGTAALVRSEAKLLARNPGVIVWTAVLPVTTAIVLGAIPAVNRPVRFLSGLSFFQIYQPILVLFTIALMAIQALPDVLTRYREMGVLKRLRTTPVSPGLLLLAQLALTMIVCTGCMALMITVPGLVGGHWPANIGGFLIAYLLTAWALLGVGMVIASLFRNAKVAAGFGTILFFVLMFAAGLWIQRPLMPGWLRDISDFTPSGAAAQSLTDTAIGGWPSLLCIAVLIGWGAAMATVATRRFTWE